MRMNTRHPVFQIMAVMRSALLMLAVTIGPYMWKINAADSSDSTQKKSRRRDYDPSQK